MPAVRAARAQFVHVMAHAHRACERQGRPHPTHVVEGTLFQAEIIGCLCNLAVGARDMAHH